MNAAELFIRCLENEGVEYIFGVPGEENAHFLIALEDSPIRFILCRHEQGAAFMADVYGRLSGRPGVCLATLGPGATNLVSGVADANMDRAPLIAITGQADSRRQHKESHQYMNVVAMFEPITKWTQAIIHPDNIPEVVRKAFKLATQEKPGACHIELADDIAAFPASGKPMPVIKTRRPSPVPELIEEAVGLISQAKKPVILAGNGVIRQGAAEQLLALAERSRIGVINTFMGKGTVPRQSEHCLFTIGLQSHDHILCCLQRADLIITIGYDLVEYAPNLWGRPLTEKNGQKIIHIDCSPAEIDEHYQVDLEIVGNMGRALTDLHQALGQDHRPNHSEEYRDAIRERQLADFAAHKDDETRGTIRPQKVLWDVRLAMGPDDIVLSDVGAHKMWVARYYQCDRPNTCLISNGFCSMGFALPGAIGAKLLHPERQVMAICGDGGFMMNVQELETARRLGANIIVMIWEDKGYGLIEWKQLNNFGRHSELSFNNPDFVQLAQSFDCNGIRVSDCQELRPALEEAKGANRPTVIAVNIDYRENLILSQKLGEISCPI
ncbi:MAG: acetolactate synthase large subunit [Thermodesulfobacteriota bacterium]